MPYLSPRRTERALQRLAVLAQQEHLMLEVALCHGKVILIAYANPTDRIVPSRIVEPTSRTSKLVRQVAAEQRLPIDWLREDVRYYLAVFAARRRHDFDVFGPNLTLSVAEPAHVLAMKLHACECIRPTDPPGAKAPYLSDGRLAGRRSARAELEPAAYSLGGRWETARPG